MKVKLSLLLQPSVIESLSDAGYEIVKRGDVPPWMERIYSMPSPVYRMKLLED